MLFSYDDCVKKYGSDYQIKKAIREGHLYKVQAGLYSDRRFPSVEEIAGYLYPNAIVTMDSAFYYYDLTDVIPDQLYLATTRGSRQIKNPKIRQIFENSRNFTMGKVTATKDGVSIKIYNRERMLVELLRHKNSLPFDYYKEVLGNYRDIVYDLDIPLIQEYAAALPKKQMVLNALQMEVF